MFKNGLRTFEAEMMQILHSNVKIVNNNVNIYCFCFVLSSFFPEILVN